MLRIGRIGAGVLGRAAKTRTGARSVVSAFYIALILTILLFPAPVAAQAEHRAGLVIVHGDGSTVTQCIAFAEESISGAELLARSGFDLSIEASSMGATICRIDGEGCTFPGETCFCQCQGSPCVYWSYWRLEQDEWRYSNLGAGNTVIHAGDVDGWRWGPGAVDKAEAPPTITLAEICEETPQAITPEPTPMLAADQNRQMPNLTPLPTSAPPSATHTAEQSGNHELPPTPLAAIGAASGALVILPVAVLVWIWWRAASKGRRQ